MAEWPRTIQPEHRVKYLVEARERFREEITWQREGAEVRGSGFDEDVLIIPLPRDKWEAFYMNETTNISLGIFDTIPMARKEVTDYVVVRWAVQQAWEDVAT